MCPSSRTFCAQRGPGRAWKQDIVLDLQTAVSQQSAQTKSGEENSCDDQQELEDEENDLLVAIAGDLAAEDINGDYAALSNQDARSSEDSYAWLGRLPGSAYIYWEELPWIGFFMGPNPLYPLSMFRQIFRVPRTLFRRLLCILIEHSPSKWSMRTDGFGRKGKEAEVKVMV